MGYTRTLIGKLAMGHLGDRDIGDIDDIYDKDALTLKTRYEHARDAVYVCHDWKWAKRDAELQRLVNVPSTRFQFAYALPPNYARLSNVCSDVGMTIPMEDRCFDIANGQLRTDAEFVFMDFVANDWSEAVWPSYFADCVALKLAESACLKITYDRGLKQQLGKDYAQTVMPFARSTDSTAQPFRRKLVRSAWNEARLGRQGFSNLRR
jgi:hypothetical protein